MINVDPYIFSTSDVNCSNRFSRKEQGEIQQIVALRYFKALKM